MSCSELPNESSSVELHIILDAIVGAGTNSGLTDTTVKVFPVANFSASADERVCSSFGSIY